MKQFEIMKLPRPMYNIEKYRGYEPSAYISPLEHEINDGTKTGGPNEGNRKLSENNDKLNFQEKPTVTIDAATLARMNFETGNEQKLAQEKLATATGPDAGWPPISVEPHVGNTEGGAGFEKTDVG